MTKSTYRTKDLTRGLLMALEGESLIIMVRSRVAGRQAWCWGKGLHLDPPAADKKEKTGPSMNF